MQNHKRPLQQRRLTPTIKVTQSRSNLKLGTRYAYSKCQNYQSGKLLPTPTSKPYKRSPRKPVAGKHTLPVTRKEKLTSSSFEDRDRFWMMA